MDELVLWVFSCWPKAAEQINHEARDALAHPNIAVDDPYNISLGFSICSAHVADLWIRPKVVLTINSYKTRIVFLNVDFAVKSRVVCGQLAKSRIRWIIFGGDAKVNRKFGRWVGLVEGSGQTFVETWFQARYGTNDSDMRDALQWQERRYWPWAWSRVVYVPGLLSMAAASRRERRWMMSHSRRVPIATTMMIAAYQTKAAAAKL